MYLAKQKSTGKYIHDFQDKATPETLIKNASILGIPANDVEVINVSEIEYTQIVEAEIAPIKAQVESAEALTQSELRTIGAAAATKLGFSNAQMKKFVMFIRHINLDTL